jgi:hypothetical protein
MTVPKLKTEMQGNFNLYFGFFMAALYLFASGYVIWSKDVNLPSTYRYLFAFILICYGVLRGFKGYMKWKNKSQELDV